MGKYLDNLKNLSIEKIDIDMNNATKVNNILKSDPSGGWVALGILTICYIWLVFLFSDPEGRFQADFLSSWVAASSINLVVGIVLIYLEMFSSWQQFMWFGVSFLIGLICAIISKSRE